MASRTMNLLKVLALVVLALVLASGVGGVLWWRSGASQGAPTEARDNNAALQLVGTETIGLPLQVVESLHVDTAPVRTAPLARPLEMYGQLVLDTDHLVRIRPRFAGEVQKIGRLSDQDPDWTEEKGKADRPLKVGDHVKKGQLLVELFSKDLGEKKSEYVDGLSQLRLDVDILERSRKLYNEGALPERQLLENERRVEGDRIAVARAERTLRSWGLTDADIKELEDEANRIRQHGGVREPRQYERWARVIIKAPFDGTVVEKNVALGELVDATISNPPLFQIADFSQMTVWAWPYEEDLPALQRALNYAKAQGRPLDWKVAVKADPTAPVMEGHIDDIRPFIDPTQHTPGVTGQIKNPGGQLLSGTSITATVDLLGAPDELQVPATALIQGGPENRQTLVLVQVNPANIPATERKEGYRYYALHKVTVTSRGEQWVTIRGQPEKGAEPLKPGDVVVSAGAIELRAALDDLQSSGDK